MRRKVVISSIVVLLLCGSLFGGYLGLRWRAMRLRDQGYAAAREADYALAADLLGRYLRRYQGDSRALREYVRVRELSELPNGQHLIDTVLAVKLLMNADAREARDFGGGSTVLRRANLQNQTHLLSLYAKLRRFPEVLDTANTALENAEALLKANPTDLVASVGRTDCLRFKILALRRMGHEPEALKVAREDWVARSPLDLEARLACAELKVAAGESPEAVVAEAEEDLKKHPGDARFELLLGAAHGARGDIPAAQEWLAKAAAHPQDSDQFAKALSSGFEQIGRPDLSLGVLESRAGKGGPEIRHLLGRRYWERNNWKGAGDMLADVDAADRSTDVTLSALRVIACDHTGDKSVASGQRSVLAGREQAAARAWTLVLDRVLDSAEVDDRRLAELFNQAVRLDPSDSYLNYYAGDSAARLGEISLSIEFWRRSVASNPDWVLPAARLVDALLLTGRTAEALRVASLARRTATPTAAVLEARARAMELEQNGAGDADALLAGIRHLEQYLPDSEQTQLAALVTLAQKGDKAGAGAGGRKMMERTSAPSLRALSIVYAVSVRHTLGLREEVLSALDRAYTGTPGSVYLHAIDLFVSGQPEAGRALLDKSLASAKVGDPTWGLVRAQYLETAHLPGTTAAWTELGDRFTGNLAVQHAVAQAPSAYLDRQFMERTIGRLRLLTSEFALEWRLAKARLLVEYGRGEGDRNEGALLLNKILAANGDVPEAHLMLAHALLRMQKPDDAIGQLQLAWKLKPADTALGFELAELLQGQTGGTARAALVLDDILPRLTYGEGRRRAALILVRSGAVDRAIQVLEAGERDRESEVLLARLYFRQGNYQRAEQALSGPLVNADLETVKLAASLQIAQGREDGLKPLLSTLDALKLAPGVASVVRGDLALRLNDLPRAMQAFGLATRQDPANAYAWRMLAVSQLRSGLDRDALASFAAATRALPKDQSLNTLSRNSALLGGAAADQELQPVVLAAVQDATGPDTGLEVLHILIEGRKRADNQWCVEKLKLLAERHPQSLIAQVALVECELQMGRGREAMSVAKQAMRVSTADPETAHLVVSVILRLVRSGRGGIETYTQDFTEACEKWKQRSPEQARAADVEMSRLEISTRHYERALARLSPYLAAAKRYPTANLDLITGYAVAAANTGRVDEVAALLWPLAQQDSRWRIAWISVAEQMDSAQDAIAWLGRLEAVLSAGAPDERITLADAYEQVATRPAMAFDANARTLSGRADQIYAQVAASSETSVPVLLACGQRAERKNQIDNAIALYRRTLALRPDLTVAANNLAWVLARHGGDPAEALRLANQAVIAEPRNAIYRDTLAFVLTKNGDTSGAVAAEHAAVLLSPDRIAYQVREADYLRQNGQLEAAREALKTIDASPVKAAAAPEADRAELNALRTRLRS
jgi:tetratricopeptide (TPR) repeat protein